MTIMSSTVTCHPTETRQAMGRSAALADRLLKGAAALAAFARSLTDSDWRTTVPGDGRPVGVIVHHVASVYPLEVKLAQMMAAGTPIVGVMWATVHEMNAAHAIEFAGATKEEALALLEANSAAAAEAIRALSDDHLAEAVPVSLYADAELTCQFMLEDHAVRHSYHHLGKLRATLAA
jgi:hypothetical protein